MGLIEIIAAILVILGIIGSIIPALPGPVLSFSGILLLFFEKGSETIPAYQLAIFGILAIFLLLADYLVPILGAKVAGSTKNGTYGAIIGALLGIIFFPPLGIFIGAFLGAVAGEYRNGKTPGESMRAGGGVILGSIAMIVSQVAYSAIAAVYFFAKLD